MATNNGINNKARQLTVLPTATGTGNAGEIRLRELATNGTNYTGFKSPDNLASNLTYTMPTAYPLSDGQVLSGTTAGVLSWITASSGSGSATENYIINPEMTISQRGTSFANIGATAYFIDRYRMSYSGTMAFTASQDTDVPTVGQANFLFRNSALLTVTTADTSIAAGDFAGFLQFVEGYSFANLAQKSFTFSFWVKSSITGTYCVAFRNSGTDRSYIAEYTINSANTWEKKTITVTASPSAGTWNYTNGVGLQVFFCLACGSTFQTTANAWNTGNFLGTANQVNFTGTNAATFRVTGLKLEPGTTATDFSTRPFGLELNLCSRYYAKSYALTTPPGTITTANFVYIGFALNNTFFYQGFNIYLPVEMRTAPTATLYSTNTSSSGVIRNTSTNTDVACAVSSGTKQMVLSSGTASLTNNNAYQCHWTADAEL